MEGEEIKEKLKTEAELEEERYQGLVEEELLLVKRANTTATIEDDSLPPVNKADEYGNLMPHLLIDGKYLPKPLADIKIQERLVIREYQNLERIKKEAKEYLKVSEEGKKSNK